MGFFYDNPISHSHLWGEWQSNGNYHWKECENSDCEERDSYEAHDWNEGVVTTPATHTEDGIKTFTCMTCGKTKIETIGAEGHSYSSSWTTSETQHWYACLDNDCDSKDSLGDHSWGTGVTTAGVKTYTCSVCGKQKTESIATPFTVKSTNRTMVGFTGEENENLVIPATFQGEDGTWYKVKNIENGAFAECTSLTSVEIPDSVAGIGIRGFAECTSLTSVVIGDSVTVIAEGAFTRCSSLTSVVMGNSVHTILSGAFAVCTSLTSIEIPDSVTKISSGALPDSLTSIKYNGTTYNSVDAFKTAFNAIEGHNMA